MDGNNRKKVSIIVVAYNMSATIDETLTSICNQTYKNIEIICVDDCSTDDTLQKMNRWESSDKRIKIVRRSSNGGILAARYSGITAASGEYTLFIDADDTYEERTVSILAGRMDKTGADICEFGTKVRFVDAEPTAQQVAEWREFFRVSNTGAIDGNILERCFVRHDIKSVVWNKIYKTNLVKQAFSFFNNEYVNMAEDFLLSFMLLNLVEKYDRISDKLINYSVGCGMSTKKWSNAPDFIERRASVYYAFNIIEEWSEKFGFEKEKIKRALASVKETLGGIAVREPINFCSYDMCQIYFDAVKHYISRKDYLELVIKAVYHDKTIDVRETLPRIRANRWLSEPDKKTEIKTVGLYYYRMFNGGVERVISLLSEILKAEGLKVVVITDQEPNELDHSLAEGTIRAVLGTGFNSEIDRAEKLEQIITDYNIDAVVYNAWLSENLILDSLAVKACGIPFVTYAHGVTDSIYRFGMSYLMPQNIPYLMSDVVVTLSDVSQAWWEALGYKSIKVINPATFDVQKVSASKLNTKDVLWVGRLSAEKQYSDAFDIADIVHSSIPDFRLRVVGTAENEDDFIKLKEELENSGRSEYIILEGYHNDMEQFYSSAAAQLCTSEIEAYPMTFLEGKVFGLPLVTYEIPEIDFVRYPKGIFIVRQRDRDGAAQRIIELLTDNELRERMGHEARQDAERLSAINLGRKWLDIFKEAMIWEEKTDLVRCRPIVAAVDAVMNRNYDFVSAQKDNSKRKSLSLLIRDIYHFIVPYSIQVKIYNMRHNDNRQ